MLVANLPTNINFNKITTMAKKYKVKKGDSLWQIAKDNNISLDELIRLNTTKKKYDSS